MYSQRRSTLNVIGQNVNIHCQSHAVVYCNPLSRHWNCNWYCLRHRRDVQTYRRAMRILFVFSRRTMVLTAARFLSCRRARSKARTSNISHLLQRLHVSETNRSFFSLQFHCIRRLRLFDLDQRQEACEQRAIFILPLLWHHHTTRERRGSYEGVSVWSD
jgi:hypothetical protein